MTFSSAFSSIRAALLSPFKTASSITLPESLVLKPISRRTLSDEDEWPQFVLNNAEVFDGPAEHETGSFTTLLAASDDHRLCVTGRLDRLDDREQKFLQSGASLPARITIANVQHFAYGQYDSGEIAFWAAGKAGWFEIRPSRQYRDIYEDMVEAIEFLYFVADLYRERGRNRGKNTPIDTILSRYADEPAHECIDSLEAAERLSKHKHVLLELMFQGKEGIGWTRTPMYKYLQELPENLEDEQLEDVSEADGDDTSPARYAGKGKSALRPRGSKHSGKGKGRRSRRDEPDDEGAEDEEMRDSSPLGDRMPSKRKSEEVDDSDTRERKSKKRRKGRGARTDDIEEQSGESDDSVVAVNGNGERLGTPKTGAKGAGRRIPSKHPTKEDSFLSIIAATLPSLEPNSTQTGVWSCQFDGCDHLVYDATSDKSRELIKEHLKKHAYESQRKIDLIQSEERPYLPVGNLIQRIHSMAQQGRSIADSTAAVEQPERSVSAVTGMDTTGRDPWDSKPYPKPIMQRY